MTKRHIRTTALALLLGSTAPAALAQALPTAPKLGGGISQEQALALSARLDALEAQNRELQDQIADLKTRSAAGDQAIREQVAAEPKVSLSNGRPTFTSADGRFTASIRGVAQLDATHYDQDAPGPLATDYRRGSFGDATEADRARDLSDGLNFRRARLGIEGKAFGDWNYNFLFDFGGSGTEEAGKISALYVEYAGLKPFRLRAGAFPPTTGLEDATSNSASLFLERAAVAELVRGLAGGDGRAAVALYAGGDRWTAMGAFTGNLVTTQTFDEQLGFVGRVSYLPYKAENSLIHIGANANLIINPAATGPDVEPAGAATPIRLRERPENRVDPTRLVDTGSIDADGVTALGLEAGWQYRNFSLAGEHFWLDVDRRTGALENPDFSGWYVQGAWTITGQPRRYNAVAGGFDAPRVEKPFDIKAGTWGVWELAARYSTLDLDYGAGTSASRVFGGRQDILTIGLNWYPNSVVRFLADFQHVEVDRISPGGTAWGAGALTPPAGAQVGQDLNIWSLRTQYAF
ncbi:OprO/OprP family phosphate-selective porin [Phenylobacterium sp. J367]|uniref:OprO/OprP family phosphate-selective porin n=1 Tax=Phenylobacterium sp. J367 TaxID=2898435 RepID=UPI002151AC2B|nr:OprO/OprP family phosphate-selective porin [Phenylobacterium sp. J367]MCR5879324.1 OprO/OprP family phosphate-selective porin [Phenylobacterium sp. J367]